MFITEGANYKHGYSGMPIYNCWNNIKQRCYNVNDKSYKYIGGLGVKVCDRWLDEDNGFLNFLADVGEKEDGFCLYRKDISKDYTPENSVWVSMLEVNRNKNSNKTFTINHETKCLAEWAEVFNVAYANLQYRIKTGWKIEELFTPKVQGRYQMGTKSHLPNYLKKVVRRRKGETMSVSYVT